MNREIKFRAWYPAECFQDGKPRMFYDVDISAKGKPMYLEGGWDYMGDEEKAIPMQYTGLKDKNGVEIYEGDIVEFVGGGVDILSCGSYRDQIHNVGAILCVVSLVSGFNLCTKSGVTIPNLVGNVDNYQLWNAQNSLKVIGNICENAELLK